MRPRNRLRELRKSAGLRQEDLAEQSGISQAAISQLENDQRPLTLDYMRTFARIIGCAPADFLPDEDNPTRVNDDEAELLANYRAADQTQRAMISRVAEPVGTIRSAGDPAEERPTPRRPGRAA
jgi:transcriptional regulator with XRE-family HTH domain